MTSAATDTVPGDTANVLEPDVALAGTTVTVPTSDDTATPSTYPVRVMTCALLDVTVPTHGSPGALNTGRPTSVLGEAARVTETPLTMVLPYVSRSVMVTEAPAVELALTVSGLTSIVEAPADTVSGVTSNDAVSTISTPST